jgi:hypothetical protein
MGCDTSVGVLLCLHDCAFLPLGGEQATSRQVTFYYLLTHYYFRSGFRILVSFLFWISERHFRSRIRACMEWVTVRDWVKVWTGLGDCRVYDIGKKGWWLRNGEDEEEVN